MPGAYDDDDDDDDFPIQRPRLSLPIDIDDDDDDDDYAGFRARKPRISILEEDEYTSASIEAPRRVSRVGQMSPYDARRYSGISGPEVLNSDAEDTAGIDSGFFPSAAALDDGETGNVAMDDSVITELQRIDDDRRRTLLAGRESDFLPIEVPDLGGEETTFIMQPPESSPVRAAAEDVVDGVEDDPEQYDDMPAGMGSDYGGYSSDGNEPMPMPDFDDEDNDMNNDVANDDDDEDPTRALEGMEDVDITRTTNFDETVTSTRGDAVFLNRPLERGTTAPIARLKPGKKAKKISRHGIEYPSLPQGVVKRLATTFARNAGIPKAKISGDTLAAIMQASDWFFEQLGDDLAAYARHAGRKTIDESDMLTLMRRYVNHDTLIPAWHWWCSMAIFTEQYGLT